MKTAITTTALVTTLYLSSLALADTRSTILSMEQACTGKSSTESAKVLADIGVKCRPYVDHGGQQTPDVLAAQSLTELQQQLIGTINEMQSATISKNTEQLAALLTDDFVIIQPGGNAWDKETYLNNGFAHLRAMFTEMSFDIEPIRILSDSDNATVVARFRLGGLHMGKPATTFGLSTITLNKINEQWMISVIHNTGMQVY